MIALTAITLSCRPAGVARHSSKLALSAVPPGRTSVTATRTGTRA